MRIQNCDKGSLQWSIFKGSNWKPPEEFRALKKSNPIDG